MIKKWRKCYNDNIFFLLFIIFHLLFFSIQEEHFTWNLRILSYLTFVLTSFNINGLMLSKMKEPTELMTPWKTDPRNPRFLKSRSIFWKVRSMSISWACNLPSVATSSLAIPSTFTPLSFTVKLPADLESHDANV